MKKILTGLVLAAFCGTASATLYNIDAVLAGGGGFGASLFHEATGSDYMSGATLADIPDEDEADYIGVSGSYNDVTGAFTVNLNIAPVGAVSPSTVTLTGDLFFTAGLLDNNYSVYADFSPDVVSPLADANIGFLPGYLCCGFNGEDPNSFVARGSDMIMSLWGANFSSALPFDGVYDNKTNLGMDLRLRLTEVPVPAAAWLFGTGLLGLVAVARRKAA